MSSVLVGFSLGARSYELARCASLEFDRNTRLPYMAWSIEQFFHSQFVTTTVSKCLQSFQIKPLGRRTVLLYSLSPALLYLANAHAPESIDRQALHRLLRNFTVINQMVLIAAASLLAIRGQWKLGMPIICFTVCHIAITQDSFSVRMREVFDLAVVTALLLYKIVYSPSKIWRIFASLQLIPIMRSWGVGNSSRPGNTTDPQPIERTKIEELTFNDFEVDEEHININPEDVQQDDHRRWVLSKLVNLRFTLFTELDGEMPQFMTKIATGVNNRHSISSLMGTSLFPVVSRTLRKSFYPTFLSLYDTKQLVNYLVCEDNEFLQNTVDWRKDRSLMNIDSSKAAQLMLFEMGILKLKAVESVNATVDQTSSV